MNTTKYLAIRNPGVADYHGLTLLGVTTTKNAGYSGTIGLFGSGTKLALALLLRYGIEPVYYCGTLRMEFLLKEQIVKGDKFHIVCVKYNGKDLEGNSKTSTEELGFTLEWGVENWKSLDMAFREIVSNAIDGSIIAGGSHKSVKFELVDKPRAKNGYTTVFLPYTEEVEAMYQNRSLTFLHFTNPEYLAQRILPKRYPNTNQVLIYKKGVLAHVSEGNSLYDYNLGDELELDESRNAKDWEARYYVAQALKNAEPKFIVPILQKINKTEDFWEGNLESNYLQQKSYDDESLRTKRELAFQTAWKAIAGEKGVMTTGTTALASFVEKKGYNPVLVQAKNWISVLESYNVPSETNILTKNEIDGKFVSEPTEDMLASTLKVWKMLESIELTDGKTMPGVKSFYTIMDAGSQCMGYFVPQGTDIYIHKDLTAGPLLDKVVLEEMVHFVTNGATDGSRDLQDFLFRVIGKLAFSKAENNV